MRIARTSSRSPNEAMEVVAASAWVEVDMSLGVGPGLVYVINLKKQKLNPKLKTKVFEQNKGRYIMKVCILHTCTSVYLNNINNNKKQMSVCTRYIGQFQQKLN